MKPQSSVPLLPAAAEALPSCAFFTFFNTAQSLNCVAFTSDASIVAGGFADSSVRLYDLQARAAAGGAGDWVTYFSGHSGPVYGLDFRWVALLLLALARQHCIAACAIRSRHCPSAVSSCA
jgi:transcription initiation factor TFIID subunit 5